MTGKFDFLTRFVAKNANRRSDLEKFKFKWMLRAWFAIRTVSPARLSQHWAVDDLRRRRAKASSGVVAARSNNCLIFFSMWFLVFLIWISRPSCYSSRKCSVSLEFFLKFGRGVKPQKLVTWCAVTNHLTLALKKFMEKTATKKNVIILWCHARLF